MQNEVAPVHGVDRLVAGPAADIHHFEDPLPDAAAVAAAAVAASAAAARSEAAPLGGVAGAGGPPEAGQRMAFITQCLHVRRSFADQRAGTAVEFSPIPLPPLPEKMTVCSTLKLVAHPGVRCVLLSFFLAAWSLRAPFSVGVSIDINGLLGRVRCTVSACIRWCLKVQALLTLKVASTHASEIVEVH